MHIRQGPPILLPRPSRGWRRPQGPSSATESLPSTPSSAVGDGVSPKTNALQAPRTSSASAVTAEPPTVGTQRDFWTWDFSVMPPAPKRIHTTLRAVGEHAEFWVDNEAWEMTVQPSDVELLNKRFNEASPCGSVDPTRGVFDIDRAYFGDMPRSIDQSPRAAILITPFASLGQTTLDGYFNAFDQMPDSQSWPKYQQHSNERNIIYLNANGPSVSGDYMQGVLAHEFSHLLQYGRNQDESSWLGETLAEVAMTVNGYHTDFGHVTKHQTKPASPLETDTYVDYGAAYLFGTYMLERYGQSFVSRLASQPGSGREAVDAVLRVSGSTDTFQSLVADWVVANYADAQGAIAPGHHYASLDVPAPSESVLKEAGDKVEGTLPPTGAAYVRVSVPQGAAVHVAADGGAAALRLLHFEGARLTVQDVEAGKTVSVPRDGVLAIASVGTDPMHYTVTA